jgi:hypothetical protein
MPRRMSPEREHEYTTLSAFLGFWATHVHQIDPTSPSHPSNVLSRIAEGRGKSCALEGLRQAINDTIEDCREYPNDVVMEMDRLLSSVGLITLSELRRRYSSQYQRILRRGCIRNDTEYYLVSGVLADTASAVPESERIALEAIAAGYGGST